MLVVVPVEELLASEHYPHNSKLMVAVRYTGPKDGSFSAAVETELVKDALNMGLCGVAGDAKGPGYFLVASALRNKRYYLNLTLGKAVEAGTAHSHFQASCPIGGIVFCRRWLGQLIKRIVCQARPIPSASNLTLEMLQQALL